MGPKEQRNGTIIRECEVKEDQCKKGNFMTAKMLRREGGTGNAERREFGEKQDQDKIGAFMTAIMSRREKGRKRGEY